MSCLHTWVENMMEETWESTAINVGGKSHGAVGRSRDHMWGVYREFLAKMFNNICIKQISDKLWGDKSFCLARRFNNNSIQNSEKLRERVRVWTKWWTNMSIQTHKEDEICLHTKKSNSIVNFCTHNFLLLLSGIVTLNLTVSIQLLEFSPKSNSQE